MKDSNTPNGFAVERRGPLLWAPQQQRLLMLGGWQAVNARLSPRPPPTAC